MHRQSAAMTPLFVQPREGFVLHGDRPAVDDCGSRVTRRRRYRTNTQPAYSELKGWYTVERL